MEHPTPTRPDAHAPTFRGTGPHGHRGRMRTRLLANPAALADYEILEMLLFLCIPRRDTKPQAKELIQRFGNLSATLGASGATLAQSGLPPGTARLFDLVAQAAAHISRADARPRPRLGDWAALEDHLDLPSRALQPPGHAVLLLDSRNQLLAERSWPAATDWTVLQRDLLRHALREHAAAAIVIRSDGARFPVVAAHDRERHAELKDSAATLSVLLHDWLVIGGGEWVSLRQAGRR